MRLLAASCAGFLAFAAMGYLLGAPPRLELRRAVRAPRLDRRALWLRQAGAGVSAQQFYAGSAAAGVATFALLWLVLDAWSVALVPAVLSSLVPQTYYARCRRQRMAEVVQAWPDGLRDLAASVNARLSLHQAIRALAQAGPEPLRRAFDSYEVNARVSGMIPALEHVKEELADPTSDRVLEVLILAKDRGPAALGRVLEALATATGQDLRTDEEIETARQEPKLNARITASLPWAVLLLLCLGDTPHRAFYGSGGGLLIVLVSAAFTFGGLALVGLLARDPVESRVFVGEGSRDG